MWALVWGTRQGLAEEPLTAPLRKRRYFKLRAKVRQMIEEVTRLLRQTVLTGPAEGDVIETDSLEDGGSKFTITIYRKE